MHTGLLTAHLPWEWIVPAVAAVIGVLGLVALCSPPLFTLLASYSKVWVDTERFLKKLDQPVDIDRHVLRHCRLFGAVLVTAALAVLTWLCV